MNKTLNKDNSKLPRRTDTAGCRSSLKDGSTIYKEEAKRNRKNAWMAYVAAFHLRFAPAAPPWRPRVRGMRQDCGQITVDDDAVEAVVYEQEQTGK